MIDRNKFIEDNMGLVHACCHRFKGRGVDYEDLFQTGCIGLIKAADGFDESRGLMFSTYAVPVILGEIKRIFRDGGAVKVSRGLKELSIKVISVKEKLSKQKNREPTLTEIAEELGVTSEEVAEALCASQPVLSLTFASDDGGEVVMDIPAEDKSDKILDTISIISAMDRLDQNDRDIIKLRYYNSKTQSETAKQLGMTQVQVSRRERVILQKMRKMMA